MHCILCAESNVSALFECVLNLHSTHGVDLAGRLSGNAQPQHGQITYACKLLGNYSGSETDLGSVPLITCILLCTKAGFSQAPSQLIIS